MRHLPVYGLLSGFLHHRCHSSLSPVDAEDGELAGGEDVTRRSRGGAAQRRARRAAARRRHPALPGRQGEGAHHYQRLRQRSVQST